MLRYPVIDIHSQSRAFKSPSGVLHLRSSRPRRPRLDPPRGCDGENHTRGFPFASPLQLLYKKAWRSQSRSLWSTSPHLMDRPLGVCPWGRGIALCTLHLFILLLSSNYPPRFSVSAHALRMCQDAERETADSKAYSFRLFHLFLFFRSHCKRPFYSDGYVI